jgi:hypothetical protein
MSKFVGDLITKVKEMQGDIGTSLASGAAINWESYQRMVGINIGLQNILDLIEKQLEEEEKE